MLTFNGKYSNQIGQRELKLALTIHTTDCFFLKLAGALAPFGPTVALILTHPLRLRFRK
jgi:hypothetical protein